MQRRLVVRTEVVKGRGDRFTEEGECWGGGEGNRHVVPSAVRRVGNKSVALQDSVAVASD